MDKIFHFHVHLYEVAADVSAEEPSEQKPAIKVPILKRFNVRLKQKAKVVDTLKADESDFEAVGSVDKSSDIRKSSQRGSPRWQDRMGPKMEVERVQQLAVSAKQHLELNRNIT